MEGVLQVDLPPAKKKKWETLNFNLSILCQKITEEQLLKKSKSTQKLLDVLTCRRLCKDEEYGQYSSYDQSGLEIGIFILPH